MPRVPSASQQIGIPSGGQGVDATVVFENSRGASPAAFGAGEAQAQIGLGRAIGIASDVIHNIALDIQSRDNEREAKQGDVQYSRRVRELMIGSPDAPGYYSLNGQQAIDADLNVRNQLKKIKREVLDSSSNSRIKEILKITLDAREESEFNSMGLNSLKQRDVADISVSIARQNEALDDAVRNRNDDVSLTKNITIARDEAAQAAEKKGFTREGQISAAEEAQSKVAEAVIIAALSNRDVNRAQVLFNKFTKQDKNGNQILDGRLQPKLQEMLNQSVDIQKAQINATAAMASSDNRKEQLNALRNTLSGVDLDLATKELKSRWNIDDDIAREELKSAEEDAQSQIADGMPLNNYIVANPVQWDLIKSSPEAKNRLVEAARLAAEGREFQLVSDGKTGNALASLSDSELLRTSLSNFKSTLTSDEYNSLVKAKSALTTRLDATKKDNATYSQAQTILKNQAPSDLLWGQEDQSDSVPKLIRQMDIFVAEYLEANDSVPSRKEMQDEATRILTKIEGDPSPGFFDFDWRVNKNMKSYSHVAGRANELSPEQKAVATVDVDTIRPELRNYLNFLINQAGGDPNDELLMGRVGGAWAVNDGARIERLLNLQEGSIR